MPRLERDFTYGTGAHWTNRWVDDPPRVPLFQDIRSVGASDSSGFCLKVGYLAMTAANIFVACVVLFLDYSTPRRTAIGVAVGLGVFEILITVFVIRLLRSLRPQLTGTI